ncbi:TIGR04295 family B12-binding domain-containing radical SAM protein [Afifella sp. JA880]|uniref:TIGR04295 family B12-binding domain-containing radical SAM protein n=1 Tax=Afifella sp. JA880 TaxID=2975280 RepID=UPI0021BBAC65|nr:TIGR04295 family B12-binding domain-containing radical SAM protein [Afifella sp. JA880]MCT8266282.1 TIGR04295 family B12-binding domain-containing radical SAM protein [Afifella sp. JA880]
MKVALVNPRWHFDNSIYFGCAAPHLPLELGYAKALLERDGHEVLMLDGNLVETSNQALAEEVAAFGAEISIATTAPTYLFWRCAPPELRVPAEFFAHLDKRGGTTIAIGPHGSVTPETTLRKLGADGVVMGEAEEVIAAIAQASDPTSVRSTAWMTDDGPVTNGGPAASAFIAHPALSWPDEWVKRHAHHHHRFDDAPAVPGAEVEASRGCPYNCSFCAKIDYRDKYRRRDLEQLLQEIDQLIAQGVGYLYFVDEIFLAQKPLLEALVERPVQFGVQTRIDIWSEPMIELLGAAGCVSVEAGLESLTEEGRANLDKRCKMTTEELADRLVFAKARIPFVQANLIATPEDEPELVAYWRDHLRDQGVWANDPVPLYPYPSSPAYRKMWGPPDSDAWERAHDYYLAQFQSFSDIQDERPLRLHELEGACRHHS